MVREKKPKPHAAYPPIEGYLPYLCYSGSSQNASIFYPYVRFVGGRRFLLPLPPPVGVRFHGYHSGDAFVPERQRSWGIGSVSLGQSPPIRASPAPASRLTSRPSARPADRWARQVRPPLPALKANPRTGTPIPPVSYAWPGSYAIFLANTVFVLLGRPRPKFPGVMGPALCVAAQGLAQDQGRYCWRCFRRARSAMRRATPPRADFFPPADPGVRTTRSGKSGLGLRRKPDPSDGPPPKSM